MEKPAKPRLKVALAAVLKPLDDPRMFEKFACTLADRYEAHLVGYPAEVLDLPPHIHLHPLPIFRRKSADRLSAHRAVWKQLRQIAPDLLIIHAVELLPLAVLFKLLKGNPILYDIRENYALNVSSQQIYPLGFRQILGGAIRLMEWVSSPFVSHYLVAEKAYVAELPFLGQKFTVLQNKYKVLDGVGRRQNHRNGRVFHCLFAGTVSELYGARAAANWAVRMNEAGCAVNLTFAGHFIEQNLTDYLEGLSRKYPFIVLEKGTPLLAHRDLIGRMRQADFVVLSYQPNRSTDRCIPTKMYECLALQIPMLVRENPLWATVCNPHQAAIFLDFKDFSPGEVFQQMEGKVFYGKGKVVEAFWEAEASWLHGAIKKALPPSRREGLS